MAQMYGQVSQESDPLLPDVAYAPRKSLSTSKKICIALTIMLSILAAVLVIVLTIYFFDNHVYKHYYYKHGAVASDAGPCSEIGSYILQKDGSAIDAAIASLLCINLYNPQSAGIGGGHFLMFYDSQNETMVYYDAREVAPLAATEDMFKDDHQASLHGGLAVAVPGEIRGFWLAHQDYGRLSWSELFEPTIQLAQEGFEVSQELAKQILRQEEEIKNSSSLSDIFFDSDGKPLKAGDTMYRPVLAQTLRTIADNGGNVFYEGSLAEDLVKDIQDYGGIITLEDLQRYAVKKREPLYIPLADLNFYLPPPPSSGAVLALILNILEGYNIKREDIENNQKAILMYHRVVESFKFGYAEKTFLGDPDFVDVDGLVGNMTCKEYASAIRDLIENCCSHDVHYYFPDSEAYNRDDSGTSHLSIVDQEGNAVAATSTINTEFGALFRGNRTGIIFNNEMDDFSMPYDTNEYNIPPSSVNFIAPGKRPLSSMVPLIALDNSGEVILVTGGSGGPVIITTVLQVVLNTIWGNDNIKEAIERARFHNQLIPSVTFYEKDARQLQVYIKRYELGSKKRS